MTLAYVGLGANLGDPRRQLRAAIDELLSLPNTQSVVVSGFYRSAPLGNVDQPEFLNAVAQLDTDLSPQVLLEHLLQIENRQGRERPFPDAPRRLDLDLLLYGDQVLESPRLTLPHPRMHERAFVLKPLIELAPGTVIPGQGAANVLLAACRDQVAERID